MTAVSILRVDFREIHDFRIGCGNCGAEITISIEQDLPRALECPGCNKYLWGDGHAASAATIASSIRSYLKAWRQLDHKEFSIGFSLPHTDSSQMAKR
jgi:hypothetical protein